jgi:hypothetical protein
MVKCALPVLKCNGKFVMYCVTIPTLLEFETPRKWKNCREVRGTCMKKREENGTKWWWEGSEVGGKETLKSMHF